jgi:hypothetical protein
MTGRRGWRRKKLLDDPKENRAYWKLKEEALDCFGRGYGPVVRETTEWIGGWVTVVLKSELCHIFRGLISLLFIVILSYGPFLITCMCSFLPLFASRPTSLTNKAVNALPLYYNTLSSYPCVTILQVPVKLQNVLMGQVPLGRGKSGQVNRLQEQYGHVSVHCRVLLLRTFEAAVGSLWNWYQQNGIRRGHNIYALISCDFLKNENGDHVNL